MNETQTQRELQAGIRAPQRVEPVIELSSLMPRAESVKQRRPDFAVAIDRMVGRLKEGGAGAQAPQVGDPMPTFYLPG